jgi:hypothetical protein
MTHPETTKYPVEENRPEADMIRLAGPNQRVEDTLLPNRQKRASRVALAT